MTSGAGLEGPIEILDYYADLAEKYEPTTDLGLHRGVRQPAPPVDRA